jgi:hypothetical protein
MHNGTCERCLVPLARHKIVEANPYADVPVPGYECPSPMEQAEFWRVQWALEIAARYVAAHGAGSG